MLCDFMSDRSSVLLEKLSRVLYASRIKHSFSPKRGEIKIFDSIARRPKILHRHIATLSALDKCPLLYVDIDITKSDLKLIRDTLTIYYNLYNAKCVHYVVISSYNKRPSFVIVSYTMHKVPYTVSGGETAYMSLPADVRTRAIIFEESKIKPVIAEMPLVSYRLAVVKRSNNKTVISGEKDRYIVIDRKVKRKKYVRLYKMHDNITITDIYGNLLTRAHIHKDNDMIIEALKSADEL